MQVEDDVEMGEQALDPNINNFPAMTPADQISYVRYMMDTNKFDQFAQRFKSLNDSQHHMRALFLKNGIERESEEVRQQKKIEAINRWAPQHEGGKKRKTRRRKHRKSLKRKHSRRH